MLDTTKWPAECYYVKNQRTGAWAYFTITPAIGLLQVFGDFGTFTDNFADRWSAPGPDFKQFLAEASISYITNAMETTAAQYDDRGTDKARRNLVRRLQTMMVQLWPLFVEQLKTELAAVSGEVSQ